NAETGVWSATGSVADVNAALAAVSFTPVANWDQDVTITTRVRDAVNTGPADGTITLDVTAVNDAPTLSTTTDALPGTNEDTASAAAKISDLLTALGYADVDGDTGGMAITGAEGAGEWAYSTDGFSWRDLGSVNSASA